MENLETERTLTNDEIKQIHYYGLKWATISFVFAVFSLTAVVLVIIKIIDGEILNKDWSLLISVIIFLVIFSVTLISSLFSLKDSIAYSRIKSGEKVYLMKDKFYTKGNRYGVKCFIGDREVNFLPQTKKQIKNLSYGSLIEVEAIKGNKEYLVVKVLKIDDKNKTNYRFNMKTGGDPMKGEIYKKR